MIDLSKSPLLQERAAYLRHVTDATPDELDYQAKLNADDEADTDIKKFDATEITWLMLNSIQELKAIIDTQQTRITALEAK